VVRTSLEEAAALIVACVQGRPAQAGLSSVIEVKRMGTKSMWMITKYKVVDEMKLKGGVVLDIHG